MKNLKKLISMICIFAVLISMAGCYVSMDDSGKRLNITPDYEGKGPAASENEDKEEDTSEGLNADDPDEAEPVEKNGDIMILFTSDIHCGVDKGFTLAGLKQLRDSYEAQGYTTILVDDGDHIQGEPMGTLSAGEAIIDLMNAMDYDLAIPGNHEFDYGMDRFFELVDKAEFPYISCNFEKKDELVFEPYKIIEAAGKKIAFVGVTTPESIITSTPGYFQDENGNVLYDFKNDKTGEAVYEAVQEAVDAARAEGADYVYVMGHMGLDDFSRPWTYADVIEHTNGIDVFLDGHSHDTEQIVMKNKDGEDVVRSAVGTKLNSIGYSHISADNGIKETNILSWPNDIPADKVFNIHNEISDMVDEKHKEIDDKLNEKVAASDVDLVIYDPGKKDAKGNPLRIVRLAETNLGDLVADAYLNISGSQIAIMNAGGIRDNINKGDITYGDILKVAPFGNELSVIKVTGQQLIDALEWGARGLPEEVGGFLQVAGISYTIDTSIDSPCIGDESGMYVKIEGDRRVRDVMVDDKPIDPGAYYTVSSINYILTKHGDGYTMFDGAEVLQEGSMNDNQLLIKYITETLGGKIGEEYADPYGQGRITVIDGGSGQTEDNE